MDISRAIPYLLQAGVRVVGIGLETLGVEDFVEGGFWKGELYIDNDKKAYNALLLKSVGIWGAISQLMLNRKVKAALARTKTVSGNLAGDGLQLGATFVMEAGGATLLDYRQQNFADHPSPELLLETCGLPSTLLRESIAQAVNETECDEDVCRTDP